MRWLVELIFWLAAVLPERVVPKAGCGVGFTLQHIVRFRHRLIRRHLALAFPEYSEIERRKLLKKVYNHFGTLAIELMRLPRQSSEELLDNCIFEGVQNLRSAQSRAHNHGVLVLSGHLGNWELGLAAAAASGLKVAAVTKEIKGSTGQYIANRMREAHGVLSINRRAALRPMLSFLKDGDGVGFVLDQNAKKGEGVFVNFFGRPACTMPGLAIMAKRFNIPVIPLIFYRDEQGRHHLRFLPELEWETVKDNGNEGGKRDILHNTQRYTRVLEQAIQEHPEQWLWMHKRWRTRPKEEITNQPD